MGTGSPPHQYVQALCAKQSGTGSKVIHHRREPGGESTRNPENGSTGISLDWAGVARIESSGEIRSPSTQGFPNVETLKIPRVSGSLRGRG